MWQPNVDLASKLLQETKEWKNLQEHVKQAQFEIINNNNKKPGNIGLSIGHAEAEYLFLINERKFPGGWKVFNEKNPSSKNTLGDDASQEQRKRRNLTQLLHMWRLQNLLVSIVKCTCKHLLPPRPPLIYVTEQCWFSNNIFKVALRGVVDPSSLAENTDFWVLWVSKSNVMVSNPQYADLISFLV